MRNKCEANHVLCRDGIYYYVRRVPHDLTSHYNVKRLCFSLKTKSASAAIRVSKSINQRLEDYWLGLRLQNMDIPAIQVVKSSDAVFSIWKTKNLISAFSNAKNSVNERVRPLPFVYLVP